MAFDLSPDASATAQAPMVTLAAWRTSRRKGVGVLEGTMMPHPHLACLEEGGEWVRWSRLDSISKPTDSVSGAQINAVV